MGKDPFKWIVRGGGIKSFEEFQEVIKIDEYFSSDDFSDERELTKTILELATKTGKFFSNEYNWPYTLKIILVPIAEQIEPLSKSKFTLYYCTSIRKKFGNKREVRHFYTLLQNDINNDINNELFYNPHGFLLKVIRDVIILYKP